MPAASIATLVGKRSCALLNRASHEEVFEFWDSDILRLFRQAGIPRRLPPDWHPSCGVRTKSHVGAPPRITSPRSSVVYNVRMADKTPEKVAFYATTDADAARVYWFLDNAYLGMAAAGRAFFWDPKARRLSGPRGGRPRARHAKSYEGRRRRVINILILKENIKELADR